VRVGVGVGASVVCGVSSERGRARGEGVDQIENEIPVESDQLTLLLVVRPRSSVRRKKRDDPQPKRDHTHAPRKCPMCEWGERERKSFHTRLCTST